MQRRGSLAFVLVTVCLGLGWLAASARAEDKPPAGTWKWTVTFNDNTVDFTLNLKLDGDKVTGALTGGFGGQQETPITNAKFKNGELSFEVIRERNGEKFTTKYEGKVTGDTIKGKSESNFGGQTRSRDWEAKRAK
jgi:hypothetical protein